MLQYLRPLKFPRNNLHCAYISSKTHNIDAQINGAMDGQKALPVFCQAKRGSFSQDPPSLQNPYMEDSLLKSFLKRHLPTQYVEEVSDDLIRFGYVIREEIDEHGTKCEQNPPILTHFDAWGKRIDRIETCASWKYMKDISAREGLISLAYERNQDWASRLYQMAKLYLFSPSSGLYSCPLAMTDGAASIIETLVDDPSCEGGKLGNAYRRLTSRDPNLFWTSGQWMTEKRGGSDVANSTETVAYRQQDGSFLLRGYKWFTSATDADVVFTLARIADERGEVGPGTGGLSLFFMETKDPETENGLNGLEVLRLKNKLGTRQLPTAEMLLDGAVAYQVGEESRGVRCISRMLTLTRIHTAISSIAYMKRILQLAVDYSRRRFSMGGRIASHPLHMQTLARMDVEHRAGFLLTFELIRLLGLEESGKAGKNENELLRLLTPVCKLYTAKQGISVCSEGLESFGGAGYLEDTGLPKFLRDAQVCSIWEGTTNILSLDVLRAIEKSGGSVMSSFFSSVCEKLETVTTSGNIELQSSCKCVKSALKDLMAFMENASSHSKDLLMLSARDLSYSIARIYMASLLLEHAVWRGATAVDVYVAKRWCTQDLCPVHHKFISGEYNEASRDTQLVLNSYSGEC